MRLRGERDKKNTRGLKKNFEIQLTYGKVETD